MEYCLADAGAKGKSGVCMLGAQKQKAWLSDQSFAKKYGFQVVDTAAGGYELLALSFDGTAPRFTDAARRGTIPEQELIQVITPEVMLIVCGSVLVFGIVITWLCAYISMNKYLRMKANTLYYI